VGNAQVLQVGDEVTIQGASSFWDLVEGRIISLVTDPHPESVIATERSSPAHLVHEYPIIEITKLPTKDEYRHPHGWQIGDHVEQAMRDLKFKVPTPPPPEPQLPEILVSSLRRFKLI
jgi:hypothetical protein